jgi:DNA-binding response OmpR family regulator
LKSAARPIILILDDDEEMNSLLKVYLKPFGWIIVSALHPEDAFRLMESLNPALIILDVMLPGKDGFEVCREIRIRSGVPIIMLTARGDVQDRVKGLQLGADDYLPKPFEPSELVARIQSVLRRLEVSRKTSPTRIGELILNGSTKQVFLGGKRLELTGMEYAVLELLVENAGAILSRDAIALRTKGVEWEAMNRTIDVVIGRLRGKLGDNPHQPRFIKTVWGEGYLFLTAEVTLG